MNNPESLPSSSESIRESQQTYFVRELRPEDLGAVEDIARQWVRFPAETGPVIEEEVQEMLNLMHESIEHQNERNYFVCTDAHGKTVGFVCMAPLDKAMQQFVVTARPIELKNLYVDKQKTKGKGVGSTLYGFAKQWARDQQYTEVLLNSGPRYQDSGWPFYKKVIGDPVGVLKDFYGGGNDAPVWREDL